MAGFPRELTSFAAFWDPLRPTATGVQLVFVISNLQCSRQQPRTVTQARQHHLIKTTEDLEQNSFFNFLFLFPSFTLLCDQSQKVQLLCFSWQHHVWYRWKQRQLSGKSEGGVHSTSPRVVLLPCLPGRRQDDTLEQKHSRASFREAKLFAASF